MERTGHLQWAARPRQGGALRRVCAALALGPALSAWVLWTTTSHPQVAAWAAVAGVVAWAPFAFGVGAILTGTARDQTLTSWTSPVATVAHGVALPVVLGEVSSGTVERIREALATVAGGLNLTPSLYMVHTA